MARLKVQKQSQSKQRIWLIATAQSKIRVTILIDLCHCYPRSQRPTTLRICHSSGEAQLAVMRWLGAIFWTTTFVKCLMLPL